MQKFYKVFYIINLTKENSFSLLIFLSIIGMLFEAISISLIIPFISQMLNPDLIFKFPIILNIFEKISPFNILDKYFSFEIKYQAEIIITGILLLFLFFIFKFLYLVFLEWIRSKFVFSIYKNTSNLLFERYLYQPYIFYINNSSSQLITNITKEVEVLTTSSVYPFLRLTTELIFVTGILILLFIFQPIIALSSVIIITFVSFMFMFLTKNIIEKWGKIRKNSEAIRVKNFQNGLGAVEDIKINAKESFFYKKFKHENDLVSIIAAKQSWISQLPLYFLELLGVFAVVVMVILTISQSQPMDTIVVSLALFTGAAFKIIPSFNRMLQAYSFIKYSEPVTTSFINQIKSLELFINPKKNNRDFFNYNSPISVSNLSFKYPEAEKLILNNINFSIMPKTCIGIKGESGFGKSTLAKLIIGLFDPLDGKVLIGKKNINENIASWMSSIGYVSQNTFLTDDTILRNIAFAEEDVNIDTERVKNCIKQSRLTDFISKLNLKEETKIGEIGKKISGGEKQRIGIARALYKKPKILVLDEATNALDIKTENLILETLEKLKKEITIIFISHKKNSLKICDKIIEIK